MPSLADYLGIETDRGLSDVLAGTCSLSDAIVRLEPSGLHILPGGEARADVAELISGNKFKDILAEAREMFDYIIIDAPPLGIFTDATVLINHADGAMLVVRANRTRYSTLDRILEPLPKDRMLGVVLNQSEDVMDESQYNYGYYNYKRLGETGVSP
jgi:capsular exopolysaccharide synthesis family protein